MKRQQIKIQGLLLTLFLVGFLNVTAQISYHPIDLGGRDDFTDAPCWSWTVDDNNNDSDQGSGFKWWNNGGNNLKDLMMQVVLQHWGRSLEVPSTTCNSIFSLIANDSRMELDEAAVFPYMFFQAGKARTAIFYGKEQFMNFALDPKAPNNRNASSDANGFRFLNSNGADIVNNPSSYGRELMRITKDGLVGVGTPEPACKLHVKGTFLVEDLGVMDGERNSVVLNVTPSRTTIESSGDEEGLFIESKTGNKITIGDYNDSVMIKSSRIICDNGTQTDDVYMSVNTMNHVVDAALTVAGATYIGPKADLAAEGKLSKFNQNFLSKYCLWVEKGIVSEDFAFAGVDRWQDCVFNPDYDLLPLEEVKSFIDQNKHLPHVPSEKSIKENGYTAHEMNMIFMQKIEELTLYTISLNETIKEMKKELVNYKQ